MYPSLGKVVEDRKGFDQLRNLRRTHPSPLQGGEIFQTYLKWLYLGIDNDIIWSIITDEIPVLLIELQTLKQKYSA